MTCRLPLVLLWTSFLTSCAAHAVPTRLPSEWIPAAQITSGEDSHTAEAVSSSDYIVLLAIWRDEEGGGSLHLVDARTGADLPGHEPIFLGGNYWHGLSPDGRTLAVLSLPQGGSPVEVRLRLIDLGTWSQVETQVGIELWPTDIAFSPDGSRLAVGASASSHHVLVLVDPATRSVIAQASLDFDPLKIAFTPDGDALMVYGARYPGSPGINPMPIAARIDATDLGIEWKADLKGVMDGQYVAEGLSDEATHDTSVWWHPAVVTIPGTQKMVLVHADAELLTTVDFGRGSSRTVAIRQGTSWIERLLALGSSPAFAKELNGASKAAALSVDGKTLYVVGRRSQASQDADGNTSVEETSLGLKVIDVDTAVALATTDTQAAGIVPAPDGRHFLLGGWSNAAWIDILDGDTLEVTASLPFIDLHNLEPVEGAPLIAASYAYPGGVSHVVLVDTASWEAAHAWTTPGYAQVWHASRLPDRPSGSIP